MGRVGSALDNAAAESFHSSIKAEYIHRHRFATRAEARLKIATWIADFFNRAAGTARPTDCRRSSSNTPSTNSVLRPVHGLKPHRRRLHDPRGLPAIAASRTRETTYLGARYHRLMPRPGKKKALVTLGHSLLTAIWHMLTHDAAYQDLGGDYYAKYGPERHAPHRPPGQPPRLRRPLDPIETASP
ncbi:integrase core domain-containing protein [Streptomyces sp. YIM 121038]|uniref:integrase core domain-containing protein n=1 Tax=Streptomyces sp. YIM 121038 TaxID=2136401 RepID=UPI00201741EC|nr:integrase core domain-containing protein [Streptomyces sp. YIM 121038]